MTTEYAPRPLRRRGVTRDLLMDGAFEVFAEFGSSNVTVDSVCERAGFTRGAFYSNFSAVDELLVAMIDREFDRRILSVAEHDVHVTELRSENAASDAERIAELIDPLFPDRAEDERWALVMSDFRRHASRDAATAAFFARRRDDFLVALGEQIDRVCTAADVEFTVSHIEVARIALAVYSEGVADMLLDEALERSPDRHDVIASRVASVVAGLVLR